MPSSSNHDAFLKMMLDSSMYGFLGNNWKVGRRWWGNMDTISNEPNNTLTSKLKCAEIRAIDLFSFYAVKLAVFARALELLQLCSSAGEDRSPRPWRFLPCASPTATCLALQTHVSALFSTLIPVGCFSIWDLDLVSDTLVFVYVDPTLDKSLRSRLR